MVEALVLDQAHERVARDGGIGEGGSGGVEEELRARPQVPEGGSESAIAAQPLEVQQAAGALGERKEPLGVFEGAAGGAPAEHLVAEHVESPQIDDGLVE